MDDKRATDKELSATEKYSGAPTWKRTPTAYDLMVQHNGGPAAQDIYDAVVDHPALRGLCDAPDEVFNQRVQHARHSLEAMLERYAAFIEIPDPDLRAAARGTEEHNSLFFGDTHPTVQNQYKELKSVHERLLALPKIREFYSRVKAIIDAAVIAENPGVPPSAYAGQNETPAQPASSEEPKGPPCRECGFAMMKHGASFVCANCGRAASD